MKKLYRYEIEYTSEYTETRVCLREFPIVRQTERCYFIAELDHIVVHILGRKERRVLKNAMNTYAYDTKEKAKEHFIRRTNTRIKWFCFWKEECERALELIKNE